MVIKDDIFGELSFEYTWSRYAEINFFDKETDIVILVAGDESGQFEEGQYDSYKKLIANWETIHKTFLEPILQYYKNKRWELGYDEEVNENYPEITTDEEMLSRITLVGIKVHFEEMFGGRSIGISFDCSWDSENGLGLRLSDEKVIEVGYQDIAI